jgi:2-C-methyl-D-erythritol 2,4-cyclodiphosphate synthase
MRTIISEVLGTDVSDVSIKATTTEGVGPEGEGVSISATAAVLVGVSPRTRTARAVHSQDGG